MNYRTATLLAEKTLTGSGVETIDLDVSQPISRIVVGYRESLGSNIMAAQLMADITKIEIVDGSEVLHGVDGLANQAVCIYNRKVKTMNHGQAIAANSLYGALGIDFGRFLYDPLLAFDPTRFRNPQLKITYDVDVACTSTTTAYLEVWAELFDQKVISPLGFLKVREHNSWTPSAGGVYESIELPTDETIRGLFLRCFQSQYEPWYQVAQARLDEDAEKRIVFDWDLEDYHRKMKGEQEPVQEQLVGYIDNNGEYHKYVTPTDYLATTVGISADLQDLGYTTTYGRGGYVALKGTGTQMVMAIVHGWLPNHTFHFPFGNPQDVDDWYDVSQIGKLRLRLYSGTGGSSGVNKTILETVKRY